MEPVANSALVASEPLSFEDWFGQNSVYGQTLDHNSQEYLKRLDLARGENFWSQFANVFTGNATKYRREYDKYLEDFNRQFEVDKINNSREWEKYMQSTQYQRSFDDLKAAGVNPYLVLSGSVGSAGSVSSPTGRSNAKASGIGDAKDGGLAQIASSALMVIGMLAGKALDTNDKVSNKLSKESSDAARLDKLKSRLWDITHN